MQEELRSFGGRLREEEVRTLGVNVYDPVQLEAMGVPAAAAAAVAERARLPSRMGGLGIVDTDYIHDAAYWGMLELVLPKLVDRLVTVPGLGQRVIPGLAQHLVAAVGSNWDDGEARYETFLATGFECAVRARAAWLRMQKEVERLQGATEIEGERSVLCVDAEYAGGSRIAAGEKTSTSAAHPQFQKRLSARRALARQHAVELALQRLPRSEPARDAWHRRPHGAVWNTLPTPETRLDQSEWLMMVPTLMGLPVPLLLPHVGLKFSDSAEDPNRRPRELSMYGSELTLFMGKGQGKTACSKAVENTLVEQAKQAGINARGQPFEFFMHCITDKEAQRGFRKACKSEACGANNCGGAVVDILLPRVVDPKSRRHGISHTNQVYDVKTCGARVLNGSKTSSCGYYRACKKTPVQFMEDEVPGLWQTKIRNVDKKWNQTKSGDLGPAAQFYATIPRGVIGLGAGAYGETGRGIQEYHELIANHASTIMDSAVSPTTPYYNRFSCCHGADDAYARIYGYFKRQLARVSVRAGSCFYFLWVFACIFPLVCLYLSTRF